MASQDDPSDSDADEDDSDDDAETSPASSSERSASSGYSPEAVKKLDERLSVYDAGKEDGALGWLGSVRMGSYEEAMAALKSMPEGERAKVLAHIEKL